MKNQLIEEASDISRTNQLQILDSPEQIAEKLRLYLSRKDQGIESFKPIKQSVDNKDSEEDNLPQANSESNRFKRRHKSIQKQVKERLAQYGKEIKYSDIQYFISYDKKQVFFLSPNKNHSGWKQLFKDNRERIFNLVFKFYLLEKLSSRETIDTFEELFFLHSKSLTEKKKALVAWGQSLLVRYNHHNVLTLTLTRRRRIFLPKDKKDYKTLDAEDLGELLVYKDKNYYFDRNLDARHSNSIYFMDFRQDRDDDEKYYKFKRTQVYYYQSLMTKLEEFLTECGIGFKILDFQASHYLENPFITNIEAVESLEIINNTGIDFSEKERQLLQNFLKHQEVSNLTFYILGNTISAYEKIEIEGEDDPVWEINEIIPWLIIELDKGKNYLVLNKSLEAEIGSMAYKREDGLWCPSTELDERSHIDFYSQLKKKYNYLDTGKFYSIQGINLPEFKVIQQKKQGRQREGEEKSLSVITYPSSIDSNILQQDCQPFSDGISLDIDESLICYLTQQNNTEEWERFYDRHKLTIAPEFEKVLIELGIKNWIRQSLINSSIGLPINPQSFSKKQFWAIYVRSPKNKNAKAVAVEFQYEDNCIYITNVMRDWRKIRRKFPSVIKESNSKKLINDQQYLVDPTEKNYISCYTDNFYTPTLIGRHGILEELEEETLEVNKTIKGENDSKLFPLAMFYNSEINPIKRIQNFICLDLQQETFIQYYIPSNQPINARIKNGFRVYHLIGNRYSDSVKSIPTSELIKSPLVALHFSTLTQNILKIRENSQSSLLQKIAKVLVEN